MEESLKENLIRNGFDEIPSKKRQHKILFKFQEGAVVVVQLLSVSSNSSPKEEQYDAMRHQIYQMFYQKGFHQIELLSVFITGQPDCVKNISKEMGTYWIIDKEDQRTIMYENQPIHFYGVETVIQDTMIEVEQRKIDIKKQLKYFFLHKSVFNYTIIMINIIIFLVLEFVGDSENAEFMISKGAIFTPLILEQGQYYRLFTAMFLHFGIQHLLNNMLVLFFIGDYVERAIGKIKYIILYLCAGLAASSVSLLVDMKYNEYAVSAGASGAIFGTIGALLSIVILNKGRLEDMTTRQLLVLIGVSLYYGFTSTNVDNAAHIGGLVFGMILAVFLYRKKRN